MLLYVFVFGEVVRVVRATDVASFAVVIMGARWIALGRTGWSLLSMEWLRLLSLVRLLSSGAVSATREWRFPWRKAGLDIVGYVCVECLEGD